MQDFENFMKEKEAEYEQSVKENQQRQSENAENYMQQMSEEQEQMKEQFEQMTEEIKETYEQSTQTPQTQQVSERPGASTSTRQNTRQTTNVVGTIMSIAVPIFVGCCFIAVIVQLILRAKKKREYKKKAAYIKQMNDKGLEYQMKMKELMKMRKEMDDEEWNGRIEGMNLWYVNEMQRINNEMQQQGIISEIQNQAFMQNITENMQNIQQDMSQFTNDSMMNQQQFMNNDFQANQYFDNMSNNFADTFAQSDQHFNDTSQQFNNDMNNMF